MAWDEKENRRKRYERNRQFGNDLDPETLKWCYNCKETKTVKEFHRNAKHRDGHSPLCKHCSSVLWYKCMTTDKRIQYLLTRLKSKCKRKGLLFDLNQEDIIIPRVCPILNIPLVFGSGKKHPTDNSPSIDRIDPSKGYTKDNIVVVSQRANRIKNDATLNELKRIISFYEQGV